MSDTSATELETGLFNIIMSLVKLYQAQGYSTKAAAAKVSEVLDRYTTALKNIE